MPPDIARRFYRRRISLADPFRHKEFGRLVRFLALGQWIDERLERLRQELKRVAEHHVPSPIDLEVPFHILADRLNRATGVRGHLLDNQVPVVAAQVVEKHWHIVDHFSLPIAEVMRGTYVVLGYVVVVVQIAPIGVLTIERAVGAAEDAADNLFKVTVTVRLRQIPHHPIRLHVLDPLGFPLEDLDEELPECVLPGEQAEFAVHLSYLCWADDGGRTTTIELLVEVGLTVRDAHIREHRLLVCVYHEGCHRDEHLVRKFEWRSGLRKNVDIRDEVAARAELRVAHKRILRLKSTEAPLAPEVAVLILCNVTHQSGEVFDPREVAVPVEQVDFGLVHMPTAINRVPRFTVTVVKPNYFDRDV